MNRPPNRPPHAFYSPASPSSKPVDGANRVDTVSAASQAPSRAMARPSTARTVRPLFASGVRRKPRTGRRFATPIAEALASHDAFSHLRDGVARLQALEKDLGHCLPDYLRTNVAAASANDGVLMLLTPHSALAARLRHLEPTVVGFLRTRGWAVDVIKVRIRPAAPVPVAGPKAARMSPTGLACLEALCAGLEPCSLRDAVEKMVERHRRS